MSSDRFSLDELIRFGDYSAPYDQVIESFSEDVTSDRVERIESAIQGRSFDVVTVMEGLYDRGNISAVMRSCEAMGFLGVHIIELSDKFKESQRVTKGADKWLNIEKWTETKPCLTELKSRGYKIVATHFDQAKPIFDFDFSEPTAIIFGNEKDGVTPEALELCDERMVIPMTGFVQSFNISVAAAISLFHAHSDRIRRIGESGNLSDIEKQILKAEYLVRAHVNPGKVFQSLLK